jgi:NADH-quinone oxidoreductase subunit J
MNLDLPSIAFYVFAAVTTLSALSVITVKNSVHAALFLVLSFFSTACLWMLLQAEFLGLVLVLVYVGAVMVLFLFVVMMLDINSEPMREGFARYVPVGLVVAITMATEMVLLIGAHPRGQNLESTIDPAQAAHESNTVWISQALFSQYTLPFEIAALILTVAVVAAILLTLRRREGVKYQNPALQVRVKASDRVRVVKMASSQPPVAPSSETPVAPSSEKTP